MLLVYAHESPSCCDDNADQHAKPKSRHTALEEADEPLLELREHASFCNFLASDALEDLDQQPPGGRTCHDSESLTERLSESESVTNRFFVFLSF